MLYSKLFPKIIKGGKKYDSINAQFLVDGGFIDQVMTGVYTFLPLGMRVLTKIENIIRKEMDKIGQEILIPSLSPKKLWEDTGRIDSIDVLFKAIGANRHSLEKNSSEYVLNCTNEDVITPMAAKFYRSYKDFPFALYQIQVKYRNEPRAKSGILRGREFRMKDLYSFHTSEEDLSNYYENVAKPAYFETFKKLGLGDSTVIALASGGDFTDKYSHEFQTICDAGEDTLYHDVDEDIYYNKEVVKDPNSDKYETFKASEVGNIFPLNTKFSDAIGYTFTDENGTQKPVYMGSYGIGSTRIMGVLVEKFNDENGIIWPAQVAPYQVHLIGLDLNDDQIKDKAKKFYQQLTDSKIEVLYDDREDAHAGEKFAAADLIGNPIRLVISKRTGEKIEWKKRNEKESELLTINEVTERLKKVLIINVQ